MKSRKRNKRITVLLIFIMILGIAAVGGVLGTIAHARSEPSRVVGRAIAGMLEELNERSQNSPLQAAGLLLNSIGTVNLHFSHEYRTIDLQAETTEMRSTKRLGIDIEWHRLDMRWGVRTTTAQITHDLHVNTGMGREAQNTRYTLLHNRSGGRFSLTRTRDNRTETIATGNFSSRNHAARSQPELLTFELTLKTGEVSQRINLPPHPRQV